MKVRVLFPVLAVASSLGLTALMMGCEVTSKSNRVSVDPYSAILRKGESVGLHASGGDDFAWSLSDHKLGTLSSSHGENVVYTSIYSPPAGSPVVQTITVTADPAGVVSTNLDVSAKTATAYITHTG